MPPVNDPKRSPPFRRSPREDAEAAGSAHPFPLPAQDAPAACLNGLTPWQAHRARWKDGCGSPACLLSRVALARGAVPCDVLFCGQAPGATESKLGQPFTGPAGIEEDQVIAEAERQAAEHESAFVPFSKTFANLVGCQPLNEEGRRCDEPPPDEQVRRCSPRLVEFVEVAAPKMVLVLGKVAWEWLELGYKHGIKLLRPVHFAQAIHPAAILKAPIANKEMLRRRSIIAHRDAFLNLWRLLQEGED